MCKGHTDNGSTRQLQGALGEKLMWWTNLFRCQLGFLGQFLLEVLVLRNQQKMQEMKECQHQLDFEAPNLCGLARPASPSSL